MEGQTTKQLSKQPTKKRTPVKEIKKALAEVDKGAKIAATARKYGVTRKTIYDWINNKKQEVISLKPEEKIKLWEREAVRDLQLAATARESLQEMLENDDENIKPDTKRAILHSASVVAGIKWDKARLEAGQGVSTDIHAIVINMYDNRNNINDLGNNQRVKDMSGDSNNDIIDV